MVCSKALKEFKKREAKFIEKAQEDLADNIMKIYYLQKDEEHKELFTMYSISGYCWDNYKLSENIITEHFEGKNKIVEIPPNQFEAVEGEEITKKLQEYVEAYFGSYNKSLSLKI